MKWLTATERQWDKDGDFLPWDWIGMEVVLFQLYHIVILDILLLFLFLLSPTERVSDFYLDLFGLLCPLSFLLSIYFSVCVCVCVFVVRVRVRVRVSVASRFYVTWHGRAGG